MTLLISWVGKDSRKISSAYIASDSRFSWSNGKKFDYGRKVFALQNSPDILGYCGDVAYPTLVLNQLLEMDRDRILFPKDTSHRERAEIIFNHITNHFHDYPKDNMINSLEIIHISRNFEIDFICFVYKWLKCSGWQMIEKGIPNSSDKVIILGSGKNEYYRRYLEFYNSNNGKTSRALFQSFCHTLFKIQDLQCGGPPQLVGLYNRFNGKNFGVIYDNRRFFLGKELTKSENLNSIEWRNELFERYDGLSNKILSGAQRQPNKLRNK